MKALSESTPSTFDFSRIVIDKVVVGGDEILGGCVLSVSPPTKGAPFWEIRYELGDGPRVIYAASTPIQIYAVEIKQEQVEEKELDDDE